jgi:hypothetical protein
MRATDSELPHPSTRTLVDDKELQTQPDARVVHVLAMDLEHLLEHLVRHRRLRPERLEQHELSIGGSLVAGCAASMVCSHNQ